MSSNPSNIPSVVNILDLRKLWPGNNTDLVSIWLQGTTAYNTNCGIFTWDATSTETVNDTTVINPTGNGATGRWILNSVGLSGNTITTPITTGPTVGVYYMSTERFMHMYTPPSLSNEYNTFLGYEAGNFTMAPTGGVEGSRNTGIGYQCLALNTTGWQNTAIGYWSQRKTTSGLYNTSVGAWSMIENTTGSNNTMVGSDAGWKNTTGNNNTGIGSYAQQQITVSENNTAVGKDCQRYITTGNNNTAVGSLSMRSVGDDSFGSLTGSNNTSVGYSSLEPLTTGSQNTSIGSFSLAAITVESGNTALGYGAGQGAAGGNNNTLIGANSGDDITTGSDNTLLGNSSGTALSTGSSNVLLGLSAGGNITTGSSNIIIGPSVNADSATASNQLNIGGFVKGIMTATGSLNPYLAVGTTPVVMGSTLGGYPTVGFNARPTTTLNTWQYGATDYASFIRYGDTVQTYTAASGTAGTNISPTQGPYVANGGTSWTNPSDSRLKDNFQPLENVLERVADLTPGSYQWSGLGSTPTDGKTDIGLRAQEVFEVFPEIVSKGDDGEEWEDDSVKWGVREDKYGVISLAAIKELIVKVNTLEARVTELEEQLNG